MMASMARPPRDDSYDSYRAKIEAYFDRTALDAWKQLTSDTPVSRIRATVRAGRDEMRSTLLGWLPADMTGLRLLDAGCGTGALAVEAARRGADVVAIDVSAQLVDVARERTPEDVKIDWRVGDMADPALGAFDHVVAMDSLIHYQLADVSRVATSLAERTRGSVIFTFAPSTAALQALWAVGRLFPRKDRAPAIVPIAKAKLEENLRVSLPMHKLGRDKRISAGFYKSHALEVRTA